MIFYIASYPRSGNTWIRNLILNQFGYISSPIHGVKNEANNQEKWLLFINEVQKYHLELPDQQDLFGLPESNPLYKQLAKFICPDGSGRAHKTLLPGFMSLFKDGKVREQLAVEDETYFVKTHFLPYPAYNKGENILQVVRHPGACLWSYYNYLKDYRGSQASLSDIIAGKVGFGHWGRYHLRWRDMAQRLGSRFFLIKYEDLLGSEMPFCEKVSKFLGLPILSSELKPFEYYHARTPQWARLGKPSGWEQYYSQAQLKMLWQEHGEMMGLYGYNEPDYQAGLNESQF